MCFSFALHLQAEEAYPVDQENQGNTLVSVAPLNPPTETQEKPSINGESTEPAKTEPPAPPTNGHSTTKTADTELWKSLGVHAAQELSPQTHPSTHTPLPTHLLCWVHTAKWTSGTITPYTNTLAKAPLPPSFVYVPQQRPGKRVWWWWWRRWAMTKAQSLACWDGSQPGDKRQEMGRGGKRVYVSINQLWLPWWLQPLESQPCAASTPAGSLPVIRVKPPTKLSSSKSNDIVAQFVVKTDRAEINHTAVQTVYRLLREKIHWALVLFVWLIVCVLLSNLACVYLWCAGTVCCKPCTKLARCMYCIGDSDIVGDCEDFLCACVLVQLYNFV